MDKRSKYSASARDKVSITGDTARGNLNDNFVTEFLKYSEEYNVHPLPKIVVSFIMGFVHFSFGLYPL
ncbi:hypothetical protein ANTRET_LOCUS4961 [Anthophora retusa]